MFDVSHPLLLFDHFRIPNRLVDPGFADEMKLPREHPLRLCGAVCSTDGRPRRFLLWPRATSEAAFAVLRLGAWRLQGVPLFAHVLPDSIVQRWLSAVTSGWTTASRIEDPAGTPVASIWRDDRGNIFLPFDPNEAIENVWSERYGTIDHGAWRRRAQRALLRSYYAFRPVVPRGAQIWMRRRFARVQGRRRFPAWPIETALHDLFEIEFRLLAEVAGEAIPWIAPWPTGYSWSLVLTHDVETASGVAAIQAVRDLEAARGFRSSWNLVPLRYDVPDGIVSELHDAGLEIGVHGLYHDGRDIATRELLERRRPEMQRFATRWNAIGFRSPATHRVWEWMPLLGFDYDSSYPDTDPFEPQPGGCCSWLPYFNDALVELPITLPQDHTLFVILSHADDSVWLRKANFLRSRGGMALLITHPDYLVEPRIERAYDRFLGAYEHDTTAWKALPREVSVWWRERAASEVRRDAMGWRVAGPVAERAQIRLFEPNGVLSYAA